MLKQNAHKKFKSDDKERVVSFKKGRKVVELFSDRAPVNMCRRTNAVFPKQNAKTTKTNHEELDVDAKKISNALKLCTDLMTGRKFVGIKRKRKPKGLLKKRSDSAFDKRNPKHKQNLWLHKLHTNLLKSLIKKREDTIMNLLLQSAKEITQMQNSKKNPNLVLADHNKKYLKIFMQGRGRQLMPLTRRKSMLAANVIWDLDDRKRRNKKCNCTNNEFCFWHTKKHSKTKPMLSTIGTGIFRGLGAVGSAVTGGLFGRRRTENKEEDAKKNEKKDIFSLLQENQMFKDDTFAVLNKFMTDKFSEQVLKQVNFLALCELSSFDRGVRHVCILAKNITFTKDCDNMYTLSISKNASNKEKYDLKMSTRNDPQETLLFEDVVKLYQNNTDYEMQIKSAIKRDYNYLEKYYNNLETKTTETNDEKWFAWLQRSVGTITDLDEQNLPEKIKLLDERLMLPGNDNALLALGLARRYLQLKQLKISTSPNIQSVLETLSSSELTSATKFKMIELDQVAFSQFYLELVNLLHDHVNKQILKTLNSKKESDESEYEEIYKRAIENHRISNQRNTALANIFMSELTSTSSSASTISQDGDKSVMSSETEKKHGDGTNTTTTVVTESEIDGDTSTTTSSETSEEDENYSLKSVAFLKVLESPELKIFEQENEFGNTKLFKNASKISVFRNNNTHRHLISIKPETKETATEFPLGFHYILSFINVDAMSSKIKEEDKKLSKKWEEFDEEMRENYENRDSLKEYLKTFPKNDKKEHGFLQRMCNSVLNKILNGTFHHGFTGGRLLNDSTLRNVEKVIQSVLDFGIGNKGLLEKYCIPVLSYTMTSSDGLPLRQEDHPLVKNLTGFGGEHKFSVKMSKKYNDTKTNNGNSVFAASRLRKVLKPKEEENKRTSLQYTGSRPQDVLNNTNIFPPSRRRVETRPNPPMRTTNVVKTKPKTALQKQLDELFP
eukprot:jgi/Bigna1/69879/fgenesh1_pg.10_\